MKIRKALIFLSIFLLSACSANPKDNIPSESEGPQSEQCQEPFYHLDRRLDPTEEKDGYILEQCAICGYMKKEIIPKLSSEHYEVEEVTYNCIHGNGKIYTSEQYGTYEVTDNMRSKHKVYGDVCETCGHLVGEFKFSNLSGQVCGGYPRLYQLSEFWDNAWLLGGDNARIFVRKSVDQGQTWSKSEVASFSDGFLCANVDFFELPNHDILLCYRAIGNLSDTKNIRKLRFSISSDGGETWVEGGDIVDNYEVAEALGYDEDAVTNTMKSHNDIGFYEPYVDFINNKITVMYADDFTPMFLRDEGNGLALENNMQRLMSQTFDMDTMSWSKERTIIMDGMVNKSPAGSGLGKRVSRDGMPVYARMNDGTYVLVFEGTYRDTEYSALTGEAQLKENHPFEILFSYSKDGVNWSNPVEIYTPYNDRSKSSAPYICVTKDDRLIVSFQTDEDAVTSGMVGDSHSVMKCMISKPGIKVEDITQESFVALSNVNDTPVGGASLWNGMMLLGNTLYTCSTNCKMRVSEVPVYADPDDYQ